MRKERQLLKDVTDPPVPHGNINSTTKELTAAGPDCSPVRLCQSCDAVEQRCLPRARCSKHDGDPRWNGEIHVQHELLLLRLETLLKLDEEFLPGGIRQDARGLFYFHGHTAQIFRFNAYTSDSAKNEISSSTSAVWLAAE